MSANAFNLAKYDMATRHARYADAEPLLNDGMHLLPYVTHMHRDLAFGKHREEVFATSSPERLGVAESPLLPTRSHSFSTAI